MAVDTQATSPASTAGQTQPLATKPVPGPVVNRANDLAEAPAAGDGNLKPDARLANLITDISVEEGVDPELAVSIARCESGWRQFDNSGEVVRGKVNPADVGVFQINETFHLKASRARGYDIYTTRGNIRYAMYLIKKEGSSPWNYSKKCWIGKV